MAWTALWELGRRLCQQAGYCDFIGAMRHPAAAHKRTLDLCPLPLIEDELIVARLNCDDIDALDAGAYLDAVIVGLNCLYGVHAQDTMVRRTSVAQLEAHAVILQAAIVLHDHLIKSADGWSNGG